MAEQDAATIDPNGSLALPADLGERSVHVVSGSLLVGGASSDGRRHLRWSFVATSKDKIEQARDDWRAGRFGNVPGDENVFIPLSDWTSQHVPVIVRLDRGITGTCWSCRQSQLATSRPRGIFFSAS
ncbi:MAG: hypothetical protein GDA49_09870 [Rhodospirillales bacterium]|nr:hypothetical protein [Rhodospirillales bacterium]